MLTHANKSSRLIPFIRRLCSEDGPPTAVDVVTTSPPPSSGTGRDARIYPRLSALGSTGGSVSKTLNQYLREGKILKKYELDRCVKELRKYKKHAHALEVMEWMEKRGINFSSADLAVRLDLIAKTKGVTEAENYFTSLPTSNQDQFTYGAMLNTYCHEKMSEKASKHFKKMEELNYANTTLAFNNLISMSMKLGKHDMVLPLVQTMKARNIPFSTFTYNVLMNSYACLNDVDGAEKVLEDMKREDKEKCNWTTYSNLAALYVKAGLYEKAETALKKVEKVMEYRDRTAYHYMISLYANTSNLDQVKRIWELLKKALPVTNNLSYLVVLQALEKLNDFDGLEKCFEEWRSVCAYYDMRLANVAIRVHLRQGMLEEAELIFDEACKRTKGPLFKAREMFMEFFLKNHQIDLALSHMEAAVSEAKEDWLPSSEMVRVFFSYFEEQKDVDRAEKLFKMLKKLNWGVVKAYHSLLTTYVVSGDTAPDMRRRIEEDEVEISSELKRLLEIVCPDKIAK